MGPKAPGSSEYTYLGCTNALLPQLNRCCKSGVCKPEKENDTYIWGICQKCKQDLDCNLAPYVVSKMSDIKCVTKKDKSGKFCNNINFTTGNDQEYLKPCEKDKDCIIPCINGLCEYSTKLGTNEQCISSSSGDDMAPGIKQTDPRYQQCLKQIKNLGDPCSKATTQIGCTRSAMKYDCFVGDKKIGPHSIGCMLYRQ